MQNKHAILVTYVPATNTKPSRIKLKSLRFPRNIKYLSTYIKSYKNEDVPIYDKAKLYLQIHLGHKIESFNEVVNSNGTTKGYILHSDTFEKLV